MTPPVVPESRDALPIENAVPALRAALAGQGVAVLQAPPGAGKTTLVPLVLADEAWASDGRIVVLEPRRVAARAAARRMAAMLGEEAGGRVGYRIRGERRVSPLTRVEVVTEGVLTRRLQADPALDGVAAVIFDEFHERSLQADLGLALCLDVRAALRADLRLLVMSATLDGGPVAELLGDAPTVTSAGRAWPVRTVHLGRSPNERLETAVVRATLHALEEVDGDILVFLPGAAEVGRVADHLAAAAPAILVRELHGNLPVAAQDAALRPAPPDSRKVVVATSIAETSLTIDGIRAVVDGGLMRLPRFDASSGMSRLVTVPVSVASADQRRGRAGRQGPGTCYRLWSVTDEIGLPRTAPPEILVADLAPLALDLAEWGEPDPAVLRWLDPPPLTAMAEARRLLGALGAVGVDGRITAHGRKMAVLGTHPRVAHLLLTARSHAACDVAAILTEGDPLRDERGVLGADLDERLRAVAAGRGRIQAVRRASREFASRLATPAAGLGRGDGGTGATPGRLSAGDDEAGRLVALAYPERVGRRRPGQPGHWVLRNGRGAWVDPSDPLAGEEFIAVADVDGDRREARVRLGAALGRHDIEEVFGADIEIVDQEGWDSALGDVVARRQRRLGAVVLDETPLPTHGDPDALLDGIRACGLEVLPWAGEPRRIRARVAFARSVEGDRWPDLGDAALLADVDGWLRPRLAGATRRADLARVALADALWDLVGRDRRQALDRVAPSQLTMPSGSRRPVDYGGEGGPVVAVRLQELFGTSMTPAVGGVPVTLRLLSPAGRPVQITRDLPNFWATTYAQVRSELRARYPRHAWPEDPAHASPTARVRRRT